MSLIEVKNVSKIYNTKNKYFKSVSNVKKNKIEKKAVNDISFEINKGDLVGYIGPNGSGKSTTIKMLCGILKPDSGSIMVDEHIPIKKEKEFLKNIGVVFGNRTQSLWDLSVLDSLVYQKKIYDIKDSEFNNVSEEIIELLQISDLMGKTIRTLSLGEKMKVELLLTLVHSPKVIFLDEPTIGMDVYAKVMLREYIRKINIEKEVTILLTSHDLEDIQELASKIIIINNGEKIYDGNYNDLDSSFEVDTIVTIETNFFTSDSLINKILYKYNGKYYLEYENNTKFSIYIKDNEIQQDVIRLLLDNIDITDISIKKDKLQQIIKQLY